MSLTTRKIALEFKRLKNALIKEKHTRSKLSANSPQCQNKEKLVKNYYENYNLKLKIFKMSSFNKTIKHIHTIRSSR